MVGNVIALPSPFLFVDFALRSIFSMHSQSFRKWLLKAALTIFLFLPIVHYMNCSVFLIAWSERTRFRMKASVIRGQVSADETGSSDQNVRGASRNRFEKPSHS